MYDRTCRKYKKVKKKGERCFQRRVGQGILDDQDD